MKAKVSLLILILGVILIGCEEQTVVEETTNEQEMEIMVETVKEDGVELTRTEVMYSDYDKVKQEIMFIYQYVNYAEFHYNYGYYIDGEGNRIEYEIPVERMSRDNIIKYDDIDNLLASLDSMESVEVKKIFSEAEMRQYYEWLCSISSNDSVEEMCVAQDYGSERLYGIRYPEGSDEPEIIKIHEQGDWIRVNTDEYAQKLSDVDELIEKWDLENFGYSKEKKKFVEE